MRAQTYEPHPAEAVVEKMIELGRPSRLKGAGFYEYVDGKRTRLWPGLRETFKSGASQPPLQDMIDRMLFAEALETQKCLDEGVLDVDRRREHRLDHGHRLPAVDRWLGAVHRRLPGPAGGKEAFVARAKELAAKYGDRFNPPESLTSSLPADVKAPETTAFRGLLRAADAHYGLVNCAACGTELRADAKFCDECGAAVVQAQ